MLNGAINSNLMELGQANINSLKDSVANLVSSSQAPKLNLKQPQAQTVQQPNNLANKATQFFSVNKGKGLNSPEGGYNNECVSYLRQYWSNIGIKTKPAGDAWNIFRNFGSNGLTNKQFDKVSNPQSGNVKAGDAFFFAPNTSGAFGVGHTGVVMSNPDKNGNVQISESNWNGAKAGSRTINVKAISGVLRPKV